jgi:acetylornithine deacetylase
VDTLGVVRLARALIDIDSTTGREAEACDWLTAFLRRAGYAVTEQAVGESGRRNLLAVVDPPAVVLTTHIDCVPPFFPSREADGVLHGRGACDAKGILAAQIAALERLRAAGERRVGLLVVVGEERGSDGARASAAMATGSRFVVDGEPTGNRLAEATRGVLRLRLRAAGVAAHSSTPELGVSAIEKLVDALVALRSIALPSDPRLGRTIYTVGLVSGGVAPNVVPPVAEADVNFRTAGDVTALRAALRALEPGVAIEEIIEVPPVTMRTVPGFETAVFPFTTDVPFLTAWGETLLVGPGSIEEAHTDHEQLPIAELERGAETYERLATLLLGTDD